jgi:SH3-like domain-containing protein
MMRVWLAVGAAFWGLATMAAAEGDLMRKAPPARPSDLVEVSVAAPTDIAPAVADAIPAAAPEAGPDAPPRDPNRGAVTNLPLPRFVTLKTNEGNARRGPGLTHRIDWVFTRAGMPLQVTAEFDNWRRVEDQEGAGGWIHYSLLSGSRSAIVTQNLVSFHDDPTDLARVTFQAEADVVGRVLECNSDWCRMNIDGTRAWVRKAAIWGVSADEIIE